MWHKIMTLSFTSRSWYQSIFKTLNALLRTCMNLLIDVQDSTRADTILVTSPVPWLILDIQSKETSLPLRTLKENRMLLAHMWSRRQLLLSSVGESKFVAPKICLTFLQKTSPGQQHYLFSLGRSQCSWSDVSSLICLFLVRWLFPETRKEADFVLWKVSGTQNR